MSAYGKLKEHTMPKTRAQGDVSCSFNICGLAEEICRAAIEGTGPHSWMKSVICEAIYQWGIVNIVREPEGGLRLAKQDSIASPFGKGREAALYRKSLREDAKPRSTAAAIPAFLHTVLRTALEDSRGIGIYNSRTDIINIALIQWGLTHLELKFEDGQWGFARPLTLRQAFDLSPSDVPIRTEAVDPYAVTVPAKIFPPADRYGAEAKGNVAVPFYKPNADAAYLQSVASGKHAPDAGLAGAAAAAKEAEERARILEIFDTIDFD